MFITCYFSRMLFLKNNKESSNKCPSIFFPSRLIYTPYLKGDNGSLT